MITFGIGELVHTSSAMFPQVFGGEAGLVGTRVYGAPLFGITFGPAVQVYYVIAAWVLIGTAGMYWFTCTPLGRIINAVRDNPERMAFIGYNAQTARYLTLVLSGLFSGMAGALAAINFETATVDSLSAVLSGVVLLFTFIGGAGYFAGPIIGAVVGTVLTVRVSTVTKAWPLYLGLFFVLVVKFAPGGVAGLLVDGWRLVRSGRLARWWPQVVAGAMAALAAGAGVTALIEMTYHRAFEATDGSELRLLGFGVDTASPVPWTVALALVGAAAVTSWQVTRARHGGTSSIGDAGAAVGEGR